jgi:signal transduction histidine kinase
LNIQTRIDVSDALIKANAHLLTQALINLIDNAKQASTVDAPIVLEVSAEDAWLDVSVIDQGPGFAAGFEVTQIKKFSTKRAHGLGLGLPIVQLIAKLHEAQLIIENHPADSSQSGARVTLRFQRMRFEA